MRGEQASIPTPSHVNENGSGSTHMCSRVPRFSMIDGMSAFPVRLESQPDGSRENRLLSRSQDPPWGTARMGGAHTGRAGAAGGRFGHNYLPLGDRKQATPVIEDSEIGPGAGSEPARGDRGSYKNTGQQGISPRRIAPVKLASPTLTFAFI